MDKKMCPMTFSNTPKSHNDFECIKTFCAWWVENKKSCIICHATRLLEKIASTLEQRI